MGRSIQNHEILYSKFEMENTTEDVNLGKILSILGIQVATPNCLLLAAPLLEPLVISFTETNSTLGKKNDQKQLKILE